ncbi:MAG: sulfite exporter TauE/SafE family protein [Syntrophobacteraceae bacterium]|nr:sulfite exporter TauE/SafE family protein [Syntrophobacteraceae bacterium]
MSGPRQVYEFLQNASIAHAQWELEVSTSIFRSRKKLLILLVLCLPVLLVSIVGAATMLGGKEAYAPAFCTTSVLLMSILVGVIAGLITGCIGAGGGFIVTPALMAVGVKGILAVGTDLFHIFAKAIMGTTVHRKLGNVSLSLAAVFTVGSFVGVYVGGTINRAIYNINPVLSNAFISLIYALLLGFLGFYALYDFLKNVRGVQATKIDAHGSANAGTTGLATKIQNITIPPMIRFDEDFVPGGKKISWVMITGGGAVVGMLAAIMGVGGGFATFPMFVYVFGVSSMTTVGTDILQIIFTAGLASITQYAIYGFIFYSLAMGLLIGSLVGIQLGALVTKVVKGIHIRGFYATVILAGFFNRVSTLPAKMTQLGLANFPKSVTGAIETGGNILFWAATGFFGVWLFTKFITNLKVFRQESLGRKAPVESIAQP